VAAVGAALSSTAAAQTPPGWTVGGAVDGYYSYKEQTTSDPQFVSQFGPFAGVDLGYTWKVDSWSFRAEGNLALGYLDYRSSQTGTLQGLYNVEGEARTLAGDDLPVTGTLYVSPFAGLGYRVLYEAGTGRTTSTGAWMYDRLSQYVYVPLGLSASVSSGQWTFRPSAEYDLFLGGLQQSYLRGGDIANHQSTGFGARASLLAETNTSWGPVGFGPFIRYWAIGASNTATMGATTWYEPTNQTIEAGLTLQLRF
jgi:hypothetical protein